MVKSKYVGNVYDAGWTVLAAEIAGRYGKRNKAKGNSYRFFLGRQTSDGKFDKTICVSHGTMVKIARGKLSVEQAEATKLKYVEANEFRNNTYYVFR